MYYKVRNMLFKIDESHDPANKWFAIQRWQKLQGRKIIHLDVLTRTWKNKQTGKTQRWIQTKDSFQTDTQNILTLKPIKLTAGGHYDEWQQGPHSITRGHYDQGQLRTL